MDIVTYALSKKYADKIATTFAGGLKYQGSKQTVSDLPTASSSNKGWMYTISSNGHEYVSDGTQWIDLSADLDNKADKTALQAEATTRETADNTLQSNIDAKQDIISDLTTIRSGAALGATALQAVDKTELQNNITQEVNDRQTAINTVNDSINQEATAREQADLTLQNNIDTKQDTLTAGANIDITNNVISATNTKYTVTIDI